MLYQLIILLGLTAFLINLILNLRSLRRPSKDAKVPQPAPLISVLIPARNEEKNIRTCVESLLRQDYPNFEILVLDDNSDDNTYEIVSAMAAKDSRIRLISGQPLPEDWVGKPYACHQLAKKAKGDWLVFVDADTIHEPHMLRSTLALALELKPSLMSGFDKVLTKSFPIKIVMPVMYFIMLGWAPLWLLHRARKPKPSVAIGQFLMFPRDEYWRIGGHQAVKNRVVEDIWMGIEVAKRGGRHIAIDLSDVVSCNMYTSISDAWNGLGKSIYAVAAMVPTALLALVFIAIFFYIAPFFYIWQVFTGGYEPFLWQLLVILQVAVMLFMRWLVDSRFHEAAYSMWFQPIGLGFYIINVVISGLRWLTGAPVTWKERSYNKETTAEETFPPHN